MNMTPRKRAIYDALTYLKACTCDSRKKEDVKELLAADPDMCNALRELLPKPSELHIDFGTYDIPP